MKKQLYIIAGLGAATICLNQIWDSWVRFPMSVLLGLQTMVCMATAINMKEEGSSNTAPAPSPSAKVLYPTPPAPEKPKPVPVRVRVPAEEYSNIPATANPSYHQAPPKPPVVQQQPMYRPEQAMGAPDPSLSAEEQMRILFAQLDDGF